MKKVLIGVAILLMLSGNGIAQATVQVDSQTYKDEKEFHAVIPQVQGLSDKQVEAKVNKLLGEPVMNAWAQFSQSIAQNPVARAFSFDAKYEVAYNQGETLSITQLIYEYTGGTHGMTELVSTNVLISNGNILKLHDLFIKDSNYLDIINKHIKSDIEKRDAKVYQFKAVDNASPYYLTAEGLVFYYQQYEIAPYYAGITKITIPYSALEDVLNPKYTKLCCKYKCVCAKQS